MERQRTYFRHPDSGDHVIATDTYGFYLMETDFRLDWTTSPFRRDCCLVVVAVEHGFATVNMDGIDFVADGRSAPVANSIHKRHRQPGKSGNHVIWPASKPSFIGITATNFWIDTPINTSFLQDSEVVWRGEEARQDGALDSRKGSPTKHYG